jgi:transcriptional regulator with XRE-family HTH domain
LNDCQYSEQRVLNIRSEWLSKLNYRSGSAIMLCMTSYWQRVAQFRLERGLGKEELARAAALTVSYVYRIEKGEVRTPSYDTVKALADALNVSVTALMDGPGESGVPPALEHAATEVISRIPEERAREFEDHVKVWAALPDRRQEFLTDVGRLLLRDEESRPKGIRRIAENEADYEVEEE